MKWESAGRRHPGHSLSEVSIDSTSYQIEHDAAGRVTRSLDSDLVYNADSWPPAS